MPYKDDQIVVIAPGSYVTLHQLGLAESLTPATFRTRSCMFPGEEEGTFEPFKYTERKPETRVNGEDNDGGEEDVPAEPEFTLDHFSEDGAVWPIVQGRIVNWTCFRALMTHVHRSMSPHLHSPILLVAQPCWTARDLEKITQFFFEVFKPPGFVIVDSALCSLWAYASINACVIDVGYEKTDVSAITEFSISDVGRGTAIPGTGGDAVTEKLLSLLKGQNSNGIDFSRHVCEQLKRNPICEILPPGTALPGSAAPTAEIITNPASAAATGAFGSGPGNRAGTGAIGEPLVTAGAPIEGSDEIENDGVLDVASIVAGSNKKMEEFLAKKEKEKADKQAKKKGAAPDSAPSGPKSSKSRNADRERATFAYEQRIISERPVPTSGIGTNGNSNGDAAANGESDSPVETTVETEVEYSGSYATHDANTHVVGAEPPKFSHRDVEVGIERFQGADEVIERIADAVHLAISSVDDASKRGECWDNIILVGNGAKVRGFREALLATIQRRFVISPSSATIFTSELPSHLTTPTGTGANTPQPQHHQPSNNFGSSSVNPLLVAAVTSQSQQHLAPPGSVPPPSGLPSLNPAHNIHSSHGQTPTSTKYAKMGDYFPEWKDVGFDAAQFLGAQIMAKVLFVVDQGQSKAFMTRTDYNELGPTAIGDFGP